MPFQTDGQGLKSSRGPGKTLPKKSAPDSGNPAEQYSITSRSNPKSSPSPDSGKPNENRT